MTPVDPASSSPEPRDRPPVTRVEGSTGVQFGSDNTQTINNYYTKPKVEPTWPVRWGTVPAVADCYQERAIAVTVEEGLDGVGTVVLVPAATTVVAGMGGVGKTQIAVRYVRPLWADRTVDLGVWITAANRDAIVAGYAEVAGAIRQTRNKDPGSAAQALVNWLTMTDRRWVIVLDDLQDPQDMSGLWPPHTGTGHTVVTTRRRDAALKREDRRIVEVTPYTTDEAASYLRAKLADRPELLDGAEALASGLGELPLALAQAAAFVQDLEISCAEYLDQFRTGRNVTPDVLPDDHQHTVDRAWAMAIDYADTLTPGRVARPLLELLAFLDPNGIPAAVTTSQSVLSYLTDRAGRRVIGDEANRAVHNLRRLSLVGTDPAHPAIGIRVHALIQHATRGAVPAAIEAVIAHAAADALLEVWPDIERDPTLAQSLRANVTELIRLCQTHLWFPDAHAVLYQLATSLGKAGLVDSAVSHSDTLQATAIKRLGADHRHTLIARNNLAYWRGESGDVTGAVAEFESLQADLVRVLGADHPDTLVARCNLATWRGRSGDVAAAVAGFETLLADLVRVLGPDHPTTLTGRHELARWRGESGDVVGAVAGFQGLLADLKRVLGADHPDTLTGRQNLATWRGASGDVVGAVAGFEELLADLVRVLGPDHPTTLTVRNNLWFWRGVSGDVVGAVAGFEELLADLVRVLGPDHPTTLTGRHELARWRGVSGDVVGAVAGFEELLADRMRVLGADHPDTLATRHSLDRCRRTGSL